MSESNRRRRIPVNWPLQLTSRNGGTIRSKIVNVSGTGILFLSPQHFEPKELVKLEIGLTTTTVIRCMARIVREIPGSVRLFTYAANFEWIAPLERLLLEETLSAIEGRMVVEKKATAPVPTAAPIEPAACEAVADTESTPAGASPSYELSDTILELSGGKRPGPNPADGRAA